MIGAVDAFQEAVETARRQLSLREGRDVTLTEVLRRAGYETRGEQGGPRYHLDAKVPRKGGHRVPADLVTRLSRALQMPEDELARAAQVAAGFTVVDPNPAPDVAAVVSRFYGDEEVTEEERAAVTRRLLQIIAESQRRGTAVKE